MFRRNREWSHPVPRYCRSLVVELFNGENFRVVWVTKKGLWVWSVHSSSEQRDTRSMKQFQSGAWNSIPCVEILPWRPAPRPQATA
jgi:hypothetical protein